MSTINTLQEPWNGHTYKEVETFVKNKIDDLRKKVYGDLLVPFTIEATQDGTTIYFRQTALAESDGIAPLKVDVSTDNGVTWIEVEAVVTDDGVRGATIASLNSGDKVLIRGNNSSYGYYSEGYGFAANNCNFWSNKPCYVYGNIMSLIRKANFEDLNSVERYAFAYFFADYYRDLSYSWVLSKDGSPLVLPATTLAESCYANMFNRCVSLVAAPKLPAITLARECYANMFSRCTSLIEAPVLPATTLVNYCYEFMFYDCNNLSYIKALFTTTPSSTYTGGWVSGVSDTGTFVKSTLADWDVTGDNGIPSGWTIETA